MGIFVSGGFFEMLGVAPLIGRSISVADDRPDATDGPVAMISDGLWQTRFGGRTDVIGSTLVVARHPVRIVGVVPSSYVEDSVYQTLRQASVPTVYLPIAQRPQPPPSVNISARAAQGSPRPLTSGVGRALDARLTPRLLSEQVESSVVQERLVAILSGFFGGVALLLAGLGLYGVTSHGMSRRRTEIGVRMALGAAPGSVVRMILRRVGVQIAAGVAIGIAVSLWASQFVAALLYGLAPNDPTTLAMGAVILVAIAAFAGWVPPHRAARLDPATVLRDN